MKYLVSCLLLGVVFFSGSLYAAKNLVSREDAKPKSIQERIDDCQKTGGGPCLFNLLREMADLIGEGPKPPPTYKQIVSDGSESKPYCSWKNECKWTADIKQNCAQKLCEASGYKTGTFISASNDACEQSFVQGTHHYWLLDTKEYDHAEYLKEAQITADCSTE